MPVSNTWLKHSAFTFLISIFYNFKATKKKNGPKQKFGNLSWSVLSNTPCGKYQSLLSVFVAAKKYQFPYQIHDSHSYIGLQGLLYSCHFKLITHAVELENKTQIKKFSQATSSRPSAQAHSEITLSTSD